MRKASFKFLGLLTLIVFSSCNNYENRKVQALNNELEIQNRPERTNEENLKLICFKDITGYTNSKYKVKQIGERLISIAYNVWDKGDSTSYSFNLKNQLIKEEVYTNSGQLRWRTILQYNSLNQLEKLSSRSFEGGTHMVFIYIYNKSNQIIEERDSIVNKYERFTYDAKNYLIQKELFNNVGKLFGTTNYLYDNFGNLASILTKSNSVDTISIDNFKYNELSQNIEREHKGEPINCVGRNKWLIKYNQFGDKLKEETHDLTLHYKYVYDNNNNWIKKFDYHNNDKSPNFLITRKIKYF
jgi:hypothetical protein